MQMSEHAFFRCQQRGIQSAILKLIMDHADREAYCGGGCTALEIGEERFPELRQSYGALADRAIGVVLIVNGHGKIVTALHTESRGKARRYRKGLN